MSLGNNKVLKVTWWSGHTATPGNWTVNWFGGGGLLWHFTSLGAALRFLGSNHFSRFLRRWYLQGGTGFQRTDARFGDGLRVDSNACWFLTASEMSSVSPKDLSILRPDFIWSQIYLLLYTPFKPSARPISRLYTHNFSFAKRGRGEAPWHWCCSAWLAVVCSSRAFLGHPRLSWVWEALWS